MQSNFIQYYFPCIWQLSIINSARKETRQLPTLKQVAGGGTTEDIKT